MMCHLASSLANVVRQADQKLGFGNIFSILAAHVWGYI